MNFVHNFELALPCQMLTGTEEVLTRVVTWKFGPNLFYLPDAMCVTGEGKKKMGLS